MKKHFSCGKQSTCSSTLEGDGFEEESYNDEVGKESCEPNNLAGGVESLHDDQVDSQPGQDQGTQQLPLNTPGVLDALSDTENTPTETQDVRDFNEVCSDWLDSFITMSPTPATCQSDKRLGG